MTSSEVGSSGDLYVLGKLYTSYREDSQNSFLLGFHMCMILNLG